MGATWAPSSTKPMDGTRTETLVWRRCSLLHPGTNVVDIVAEDRLYGGGMDPLNVALQDVVSVPEPTGALLVLGAIPLLFGLRRKHNA